MKTSVTLRWFLLIVTTAFCLRALYLTQLQSSPLFLNPIMDARVHHAWAATFAAGQAWSVDRHSGVALPYFRAPLYVWFLGSMYKVLGPDPGVPARLVQSFLGSLSCGFIFLIGARLFRPRVGIAAGLAGAVCWTMVYFDNELLIVPLAVFLDLSLVLLLITARENPLWWLWAAAGLVTGLSALARPNILLFAPFVCFWIIQLKHTRGAAHGNWWHCLAYATALLVPIAPVAVRNYAVGHDLVLISSQGGVNFFIGNNPLSDGVTAVVPGTPPTWWGGYYAARQQAAEALGHAPRPSEVSRYFLKRALYFWRVQPRRALRLTALKARYYLCRQEFANNKCLYTFTSLFTPVTSMLVAGFAVAGTLGLPGLLLCFASARRLFPLWGFCLVYSLSVIMFFITARYRMPVVPVLLICGFAMLDWLYAQARRRRMGKLLAGLLAVAVSGYLVFDFPGYGFGRIYKAPAQTFMVIGERIAEQGDVRGSLPWVDLAIRASRSILETGSPPTQIKTARAILGNALYRKGLLLEKDGRAQEALGVYRELLQADELLLTDEQELRRFRAAGRTGPCGPLDCRARAARLRRLLNGRGLSAPP